MTKKFDKNETEQVHVLGLSDLTVEEGPPHYSGLSKYGEQKGALVGATEILFHLAPWKRAERSKKARENVNRGICQKVFVTIEIFRC